MISKFTPEHLLQYLYKETSAEETAAIEEALQHDWTLREKLAVLQAAYDELNRVRYQPGAKCVQEILRHAARTVAPQFELN
ncbi:MAG: hypothetical protein ACK4E8_04140 [Lacibacter sp.]